MRSWRPTSSQHSAWSLSFAAFATTGAMVAGESTPNGSISLPKASLKTSLPATVKHIKSWPQCGGIWTNRWSDSEVQSRMLVELRAHVEVPLQEVLQRHQCPFGRALPGDVTWPSPPTELQHLVAPMSMLKLVAVAYGYIPYLLGAQAVLALFVHRGTRQLSTVVWLMIMLMINELILKKILREPRPGTLLQVKDFEVYRAYPLSLGDKTQTMRIRPDTSGSEKALKCLQLYLWVPWVDSDTLTHTEFVVFISAWFVLLVPVPFMRVVLFDHTFAQVVMGSCVGIAAAIAWWRVVRHFQRKYHDQEGQPVLNKILVHNYRMAKFYISNCGDITPAATTVGSAMTEFIRSSP